jgi:hypothetical protein
LKCPALTIGCCITLHLCLYRNSLAAIGNPNMQVFILGAPRTGTSITYYALHDVFGLPGRGESHVMPLFQRIMHAFFLHAREFAPPKGDLASQLKPRDFRDHLVEYIRRFYAENYPGGRFVDKTPGAEAITGVQLIRHAFPDSRIIITRRTGVEVVQSVQRKFSTDFEAACLLWSSCMTAANMVRPDLSDVLEIDQFDLTNSPQDISEQMSAYLGSPEKSESLARFFAEQRTDQLSEHDWRSRLSLTEAPWTENQKTAFIRICGEHMKEANYPM